MAGSIDGKGAGTCRNVMIDFISWFAELWELFRNVTMVNHALQHDIH